MKKNLLVLFLFAFNNLPAQDTIHFTEALMVASNSSYGREATYVEGWK